VKLQWIILYFYAWMIMMLKHRSNVQENEENSNRKPVFNQSISIKRLSESWRTERDFFTRPARLVIIEMFIHNEYYTWLYLQSFILCQ
jgi:hypothetical protein